MTHDSIAKNLKIKEPRNVGPRLTRMINSFELPSDISTERRDKIILMALEILEKEDVPDTELETQLKSEPEPPPEAPPPPPAASLPASADVTTGKAALPPVPPVPVVEKAQPVKMSVVVTPAPVPALVTAGALPSGVIVTGMQLLVPVNRLRRFALQPRTEFDPAVLTTLSESIRLVGQLMPALLRQVVGVDGIDYEIIDGECRWIASKIAGLTMFKGIVYPGLSVEDAKKQYLLSVIANFGRSTHTSLEFAHIADKLMRDNDWTAAKVAKVMTSSEAKVRTHLKLLQLVPEVQALMKLDVPEGRRLMINQALHLAEYPPDFQRTVAQEMSDEGIRGTSVVQWHIRKRAVEAGVVAQRSRKGRRPAGDARNLRRGVERFKDLIHLYLNVPGKTTGELYKNSPEEKTAVLLAIGEVETYLADLKKSIEKSS
jgi:ParB/RepB/Spo0J family partition protein